MSKRNIVIAILGLGILWILVFAVANMVISNVEDADVSILASPTQRPLRTDVPELRADTATPTEDPDEVALAEDATAEATEEFTEEPTAELTQEPTSEATEESTEEAEPTPRYTLSALQFQQFQTERQEEFNEEYLASLPPVEIERDEDGGAYPIQIAIQDIDIFSPVLVVQTDPEFNIVTPREEVGYYALTPKIGAGGNSVMVGHVYPGRVFNALLDVEVGAQIRVTDEFYEEHYYEVTEIIRFPYEVGTEEDRELGFEYMYDQSEERITLVTCYPEYEWTHRFVVRAKPIDPDSDGDE